MRREELYLADLIDNARAVRGYLDGVTRERWDAEDILRDAVLYRMLLLGEIASALPDELRDRYPDVAWRQIRAFRNLAIHKYFGVDWAVVWKIAQEEPSLLERQVLAIIRAEYPRTGPELRAGTRTGSGYRILTRSRWRGLSRPERETFCQLPCFRRKPRLGSRGSTLAKDVNQASGRKSPLPRSGLWLKFTMQSDVSPVSCQWLRARL
jgi:uncharacterized protein with HEPN domain